VLYLSATAKDSKQSTAQREPFHANPEILRFHGGSDKTQAALDSLGTPGASQSTYLHSDVD
jgi:hypothetical protein